MFMLRYIHHNYGQHVGLQLIYWRMIEDLIKYILDVDQN